MVSANLVKIIYEFEFTFKRWIEFSSWIYGLNGDNINWFIKLIFVLFGVLWEIWHSHKLYAQNYSSMDNSLFKIDVFQLKNHTLQEKSFFFIYFKNNFIIITYTIKKRSKLIVNRRRNLILRKFFIAIFLVFILTSFIFN